MQATEVQGARFTFLVTSDKDDGTEYLVDLLAHHGFASCTCNAWTCKVGPFVREEEPTLDSWKDGKKSCKHIKYARDHFHFLLWQGLSRSEQLNES